MNHRVEALIRQKCYIPGAHEALAAKVRGIPAGPDDGAGHRTGPRRGEVAEMTFEIFGGLAS